MVLKGIKKCISEIVFWTMGN